MVLLRFLVLFGWLGLLFVWLGGVAVMFFIVVVFVGFACCCFFFFS